MAVAVLIGRLTLKTRMYSTCTGSRLGARARSTALAAALLATVVARGRPADAAVVRVKELVDVQGMRENALYGYGLVVGLAGTGDSETVFFTSQPISGMLGRLGIRIDTHDVRVRNAAAIIVTASISAFTRTGSPMDIKLSSRG